MKKVTNHTKFTFLGLTFAHISGSTTTGFKQRWPTLKPRFVWASIISCFKYFKDTQKIRIQFSKFNYRGKES